MLVIEGDEGQGAQIGARNGAAGLAEAPFELVEYQFAVARADQRNIEIARLGLLVFAPRHFEFGLGSFEIAENPTAFLPGFATVRRRKQRRRTIQFGTFPGGVARKNLNLQGVRSQRKAELVGRDRELVRAGLCDAKPFVQELANNEWHFAGIGLGAEAVAVAKIHGHTGIHIGGAVDGHWRNRVPIGFKRRALFADRVRTGFRAGENQFDGNDFAAMKPGFAVAGAQLKGYRAGFDGRRGGDLRAGGSGGHGKKNRQQNEEPT